MVVLQGQLQSGLKSKKPRCIGAWLFDKTISCYNLYSETASQSDDFASAEPQSLLIISFVLYSDIPEIQTSPLGATDIKRNIIALFIFVT